MTVRLPFAPAPTLAAAAVLLALPLVGGAQTPLAGVSQDPSSVPAGAYALEPTHTRVLFHVDHMGFSTWWGNFNGASGKASFDPKNPAGNSVDISIPTASVSTTNTTLDGELKSPEWFDAAKFPAIVFKSTAVKFTGAGLADVAGNLTFHGVTRPVVLKTRFHGAGVNGLSKHFTAGFDATVTLKRSDFGVKTDLPSIGDEVSVLISAPFEKPS